MRTLKVIFTFAVILAASAGISPASAQPGFRANVSFNTFYNELRPHGRWMNMPRFGQVWIFNQPGFTPYSTNGQWQHSDIGWTWMSDYDWGWAPFHYGRWELDPYIGWFWIPGYDYAPAWVVWSQADDYYGWAPLGFGIDINISIGSIPRNRWMYAPRQYISRRRIDRYCVPYERNYNYYGRQQPVVNVYVNNNVRYSRGPEYRGSGNRNRYNDNDNYRNNGNAYESERPPTGGRPDRRDLQQTPPENRQIQPSRSAGTVRMPQEDLSSGSRPRVSMPANNEQRSLPQNRTIERPRPEPAAPRPMPQTRSMERPRAQSSPAPRAEPQSRTIERRSANNNPVHVRPIENKKTRQISR